MSTEALYERRMQSSHEFEHSDDDDFFDPNAEEEEAVAIATERGQHQGSNGIEHMLQLEAAAMSSSHNNNRIGARCPVPRAMPLIETGDQVSHEVVLYRIYFPPFLVRLIFLLLFSYMPLTCKGRCQ